MVIGKNIACILYCLSWTGIISALAFSPTHAGMLAMGSYSQTTAIYREDNMELLYVLHGQEGGVTHVSHSFSFSLALIIKVTAKRLQNFLSGPVLKRWKLLVYWRT